MGTAFSCAGFSLIEAMIALFLLAFVLMGVVIVLISSIQSLGQARRITDATNLAQADLELLVNAPFNAVSSGSNPNNPITAIGTTGGIYSVSRTVSNGSPATNMKSIVVAVAWNEKGVAHAVELRTIISL